MLTGILIFAVLSSFGVLCAARYEKRYEQTLPITFMGIVVLLFLFGLVGKLAFGVYAVLILAALCYVLSAVSVIRRKNAEHTFQNLCTPGMFVVLVAFFALTSLNQGKLADTWDEFSHWIDVVKVMTLHDDFATHPQAFSDYASYPPGMALFQYLFQKIHQLCNPGIGFEEAAAYVSYQVFTFSLLFPFFPRNIGKRWVLIPVYCVAIFVAPMMFHNFFVTIHIEGFLGVLSGAAMARIFVTKEEEKDWTYTVYIALICAMLVLAKDSGMLFAVFTAAAYIFSEGKPTKQKIPGHGLVLLSVLLPKLLWKLELAVSNTKITFANQIDVMAFFRILVGGGTEEQRLIFRTYVLGLFEKLVPVGNSGISVSYFSLFFLSLLGLLLIAECSRKNHVPRGKNTVLIAEAIQLVVYIIGLCMAYLFQFTKCESLSLASFERYIGTAFLSVWILLVFFGLNLLEEKLTNMQLLICLCAMLAVMPLRPIVNLFYRNYAPISQTGRQKYEEITDKIRDNCEDGSSIYLITQDCTGYDYFRIKFLVRPCILKNTWEWSFGIPSDDDMTYTVEKTPQDWQKELAESYDYVVLYRLDDYFLGHYSGLFEDPSQIREGEIFRVDDRGEKLVLCQEE